MTRHPRGAILSAAFLGLVLGAGSGARADSWPQPQPVAVFSASGEHFVRVLPGEPGASGTVARPAIALVYRLAPDRSYRLRHELALVHPGAPVTVLVSDAGYIVTLDSWHQLGVGPVVAIHDPGGQLVRSHTLETLYRPEQLARIPRTVSSRHWRCEPVHFVEPREQARLYVPEVLGGYFVVTLATGAAVYTPGARTTCTSPAGPMSWTQIGG